MSHHIADLTRLMPLIWHASAHLGVEQTPTGRAVGLTNGRMMALATIDSQGDCSMSNLARQLDMPAPLATRVANELVVRDLAERSTHPGDRRRVMLRLTTRGRAVLASVHGEAENLVSAVLARMTEKEAESLLLGLRAFLCALHTPSADGISPIIPEHQHNFPTEGDA